MNTQRFRLPTGFDVRYDYHKEPRGMSAIVLDRNGHVRSVGFAKFNPRDGQFNLEQGKDIALGRALSKLPRHLTRPLARVMLVDETTLDLMRAMGRTAPPQRDPSRSIADELF